MELKSHLVPGLQMSPSAMLCGVVVGAAVVGAGAAFEDASQASAPRIIAQRNQDNQNQRHRRDSALTHWSEPETLMLLR